MLAPMRDVFCRLREERAAQKRLAEADVAWRQLLRSIWTKLRLHQDYGDDSAAAAGQKHSNYGVLVIDRDLSGQYAVQICPPDAYDRFVAVAVAGQESRVMAHKKAVSFVFPALGFVKCVFFDQGVQVMHTSADAIHEDADAWAAAWSGLHNPNAHHASVTIHTFQCQETCCMWIM